jgi:hypothetical protein
MYFNEVTHYTKLFIKEIIKNRKSNFKTKKKSFQMNVFYVNMLMKSQLKIKNFDFPSRNGFILFVF